VQKNSAHIVHAEKYFVVLTVFGIGAGLAQSVQRLATGWTTEGSEFDFGKVNNFPFSTSSRPALGSTQPPVQWVTGSLSIL
jgi:hypothetical protein